MLTPDQPAMIVETRQATQFLTTIHPLLLPNELVELRCIHPLRGGPPMQRFGQKPSELRR